MGWRQFLSGVVLGAICSILLACTQTVMQTPVSSSAPDSTGEQSAAAVVTALAASELAAEELPPMTQQALASLEQAPTDPTKGDVRLIVISDLNSAYGSTDYDPEVDKAIALIPYWQPDLVVCGGDMVAGQNPSLTPEQIRAMWAAFDEHVAAKLRSVEIPFGFTIGNHDASGALGVQNQFLFQQERDLASAYWQNPKHNPMIDFVERFDFPFYYSFRQGDVFFLAWDGSTNQIPAERLAWVEQALASEVAQSAKMRILLGHLPFYGVAVGRDEPGEVMTDADQLRALLEKYDVHTYISGHHHAYYPAHKGELQLLHSGILGSGPRPLIDSNLPPWKTLTILDIDFSPSGDAPAETRYTTFDMQTMDEIEYEELPRFLASHNGIVLRRDIEGEELTADDKAVCAAKLGQALCQP